MRRRSQTSFRDEIVQDRVCTCFSSRAFLGLPSVCSVGFLAGVCIFLFNSSLRAGGIPEPGLTLYGVVKNDLGGASVRMTSGTLAWTIVPSYGPPVTVRAELNNINDQFSYIMEVPFESAVQAGSPSTNALQTRAGGAEFDRSEVVLGTNTAAIVDPAGGTFILSPTDRGRYERVDLLVAIAYPDTDGDGLPDYWESEHFWNPSSPNTGSGDFDHDGMNNRGEYLAGCNPTDPGSCFEFIETEGLEGGGIEVRWKSIAGHYYGISRSVNLFDGFVPLETGIPATAPVNMYRDRTATGDGPYFYRIAVE